MWDINCTQYEKESLDKLQYEAERTVTGLTRSVHLNNLIKKIGWVSLSDRRLIQKLRHNLLPEYMQALFPPLVGNRNNPYMLRNNNNFVTVTRRTQLYSKSFIPSAVSEWNNLDDDIKNSSSLSIFKYKLKQKFKSPIVPSYFHVGDRVLNVMHTRIRNFCSNLNADLHSNNLSDSPNCRCGQPIENAEHYLLQCSQFTTQRIRMFHATRPFHTLSVHTLLFGKSSLSDEDNSTIFIAVQNYIKDTGRFT